jgi:iron transport multicopper oxidase
MNDQKSVKFDFVPGKRYLFRIINMSGFANHLIYFEGHNMTIVEMDGVATAFTNTSRIKIAASQRYNVIVTALPAGSAGAKKNYGIVSVMDPGMWVGDIIPEGYKGMVFPQVNQHSWIVG